MARRDLPLSVFHFDCFWMREFQWCDFEWDRRGFPEPEAETESKSDDVVTIDGKDYCSDTKVESATDDWNGYRRTLAQTGAGIALIALAAVVVLGGGAALLIASRRREAKAPADTEGSEE